jgi:hypothetical protein
MFLLTACSSAEERDVVEKQKETQKTEEKMNTLDTKEDIIEKPAEAVIPTFTEIEIDFEHQYDKKKAHPFL